MLSLRVVKDVSADGHETLLQTPFHYFMFNRTRPVRKRSAGGWNWTPGGTWLTVEIVMSLPESSTHSFIVKIWLEETAEEAGRARWRGYVTHVPSGKRRYLKDVRDVAAFVSPYLEELGVEVGRWLRVKRRLSRWKRRKT